MSSNPVQIFWRQPWNAQARRTLADALDPMGFCLGELASQRLDVGTGTVGGLPVPECVFWGPAGAGWCCLHLTQGWEHAGRLADGLARVSGQPCLVMTDHDQEAWSLDLVQSGLPTRRFLSHDHLQPPVAPGEALGADTLGGLIGEPPERLAGYLTIQTLGNPSPEKVHPQDRFTLGEAWVRVDLLRAMGIAFAGPTESALGRFCRILPKSGETPEAPETQPRVQVQTTPRSPWQWN
ncbi:MAG: hypothetical protein ACKO3H_06490 [Verrucomicrobiota bacterium]